MCAVYVIKYVHALKMLPEEGKKKYPFQMQSVKCELSLAAVSRCLCTFILTRLEYRVPFRRYDKLLYPYIISFLTRFPIFFRVKNQAVPSESDCNLLL